MNGLPSATRNTTGRVLTRLIVAGVAGASIWLSLGTVILTGATTMARIAALPPIWVLFALAGACLVALTVWLPDSRGTGVIVALLIWLPYVPGRIPAAFLIWQGPLKILVWLVVVIAFVLETGRIRPSGRSKWLTDPSRAPFAAAIFGVVCVTTAWVNVKGVVPTGDEPHYLVMTQSLLLDGDLRIENNHRRGDYLSYFMWEFGPHYVRRGTDGEIYSVHAPGVSAIVLPGFAIAGYVGAVVTVIVLTAAAGAVAWNMAWLLTQEIAAAWVGWAAVFLTSPFILLSFTIFPDGVAGLLTAIVVRLLVRLDLGMRVRRVGLVAASASIAILPWLHTRFVVVAMALAATLAARLATRASRSKDLLSVSAIPAISGVAWLSYFWLIWGTPNPSAQWGTDPGFAIANLGHGLLGIFMDQQFGLLPNAPIYAIAIIGLASLGRQRPRLALEALSIGLPYLFAVSSYSDWWAGVSAPARFLGALTPLAVLPVAWWWSRHRSDAWRVVVAVALGISLFIVALRLSIRHGALLLNDSDGFDTLLGWLSQSTDLPMAMVSVIRDPLTVARLDASVWIVAVGLMVALLTYEPARRRWSRETRWIAVSMGLAVTLMAGSSAVWARHRISGATADRSKLAAIGQWEPIAQPITVALSPLTVIDHRQFVDRLRVSGTDRVPSRDRAVLFAASSVPAADYELTMNGASAPRGEIRARIGDVDVTIDRWELDALNSGFTGAILHLPVAVERMTILGDPQALNAASTIGLRLHSLERPATAGLARRAARYGAVRVFAMDDAVFLEPSGLWTHGEHATTLVIDVSDLPPDKSPILRLRAGPVAVPLELRHSTWRDALTLAPEQGKEVAIPRLGGERDIVLSVVTGSRFRPIDFVRQTGDGRALGIWIEFP